MKTRDKLIEAFNNKDAIEFADLLIKYEQELRKESEYKIKIDSYEDRKDMVNILSNNGFYVTINEESKNYKNEYFVIFK